MDPRDQSRQHRLLRKALAVGGLVIGFGIGQGAMFLAQTWLIMRGELAYVGQIGLGLAGLSLVQIIVDCGGTFILSRHAAQQRASDYLTSANAFRALVGLGAALVLFALAHNVAAPIERGVLIGGSVGATLWSINLTGVLDGIGRTAIAGPISSLSWLMAAVGLAFFNLNRPEESALFVGCLFSVGVVITLLCQYIIAYRAGCQFFAGRPALTQMREFAREGGYYMLANVPGQFYGRGLILVAKLFLGVDTAGAVVYARNLVTAATQGITFIRRVEFPGLTRRLSEARLELRSMLGLQWWSIGGSVLYLLLVILAVLLIPGIFRGNGSGSIPTALLCLSIPIPLWALSSSFQQAFLALGDTRIYAMVGNVGLVIATVVILASIRHLGILALLWGEAVTYAFQAGIYVWYYRRTLGASREIPYVA